jgi:hypothetical protein
MYQKRQIGELGTLSFFGGLGAVAHFEDLVNESFLSRFQGKTARLGDLIKLVFSCYKVACRRLGEPQKYTLEDFEDNSGKEVIELSTILISDIMKEMGLEEKEPIEKKIAKKAG